MKKFNYELIYLASHGNSTKLVELFISSRGTTGDSFMLNPLALSQAFWVSDRHKAEYIGLCSLRSYAQYTRTKDADLLIEDLPPWVPLEVAKENPLIQVTDSKIIFLKEKI